MAAIALSAIAVTISLIALLVQTRNANREFRRAAVSATYNDRLAAYSAALAALTKCMSLVSSWGAATIDDGLAGEVGPIYIELERARSEVAASREAARLVGPDAVRNAYLAAETSLRNIIVPAIQGHLTFDTSNWYNAYQEFCSRRDAYVKACEEELTRIKKIANSGAVAIEG